MDINNYQEQIRALYTFRPDDHLQYALLNLPGEVGELLGLFAKHTRDYPGPQPGDSEDAYYEALTKTEGNWEDVVMPKARKELGDVFFMAVCLADALDLNASSLLQENLDKLFSRKERGVISGSGDDR